MSKPIPANIAAAMSRQPVFAPYQRQDAASAAVAPKSEPVITPAQIKWQRGEEKQLNALVCAELRRRGIPHVVARLDRESTIAKGWPDITALLNGKGCCVELKAAGGRLTQAQRERHDELRAAGVPVCIAYGFDEAVKFITENL